PQAEQQEHCRHFAEPAPRARAQQRDHVALVGATGRARDRIEASAQLLAQLLPGTTPGPVPGPEVVQAERAQARSRGGTLCVVQVALTTTLAQHQPADEAADGAGKNPPKYQETHRSSRVGTDPEAWSVRVPEL